MTKNDLYDFGLRIVRLIENDDLYVKALIVKDAEIEKLREERSRLREALQELVDWQNGPPLVTYTDGWNKAMEKARAALKEGE